MVPRMSDEETVVHTVMTVDDATFSLSPGQDVGDLERRIEAAVHDGGRFEGFSVVGDGAVRALFTAHTRVVLWDEKVPGDAFVEPPGPDWCDG